MFCFFLFGTARSCMSISGVPGGLWPLPLVFSIFFPDIFVCMAHFADGKFLVILLSGNPGIPWLRMICVCLFLCGGVFIIHRDVGDGLEEYRSVREFCVFVFSLILVVVAADDLRSRLSIPRWATTRRMYSRHWLQLSTLVWRLSRSKSRTRPLSFWSSIPLERYNKHHFLVLYIFLLLPSPRCFFWCTPACDLWAFTFFVQVPVLETPEGAIAESNAIARYGTLNLPWFYSSLNHVKCGTGDWCWPAHLADQSVFLLWDCFFLKLQASFCTCCSQLQEAARCDGHTVQSTGSWLVGLSPGSCLLKGFVVLFQSFLLVVCIQWQDSRM